MLALSLTALLEEATLGGAEKQVSGNVSDVSKLFEPSITAALQKHYRSFAFLAFDPRGDDAFVAYLASGTLASDAGTQMLAMFTTAIESPMATPVDAELFAPWLDLESGQLPVQVMLGNLYSHRSIPALPGIVFFDSFSDDTEAYSSR